MLGDWRLSVAEAFARDLDDCEGAKCALAPNLPYYHDDPRRTWWLFLAVAQGGYIGSGGVYIRGGSVALSRALAKVVKKGGGEVLLGRKAVKIDVASDGRMMTVHHAGKDEKSPERIESAERALPTARLTRSQTCSRRSAAATFSAPMTA